MAKKDNETLYAEFLADLKAINPQIEEIVKDEKVNAKLKESVLARSELSRQMDALATERKQMSDYLAAEKQKIDGWQKWYGETSQTFAATAEELQKYRDEFGDLSSSEQRRVAKTEGLTVEQFQTKLNEAIQQREAAYLKFAEDLTDIKLDYKERFKEKLDTAKVYEIAAKDGVSLDQAYKSFISDRVVEAQKAEMEAQIKAAREEGAREALAKHNLPVVNNNPAMTHVLDYQDAPKTETDRVRAAVNAFITRK